MDAGGSGAGGMGNGFGSGGRGCGDGGGWRQPPRQRRGSLSYQDVPDEIADPGEGISMETLFTVQPDGRVTNCRITKHSRYLISMQGVPLIEQRFRFDPARDEDGRPVSRISSSGSVFERPGGMMTTNEARCMPQVQSFPSNPGSR